MPFTAPSLSRRVFLALSLLAFPLHADYGWIPEPEHLHTKLGFDLFSTSNNFDNTSGSVQPTLTGQPSSLQDALFWLEPEFGVAEDYSIGMKLGFINGTASRVGTGAFLASGAGITDVRGSVKWRMSKDPIWTFEGIFKLPTGNAIAATASEIVTGDGNVDLGVKAHYGMQAKNFFLSVSPGFLARFNGFSPALTLEAAGQMFIHRAYGKVYVNSIFSLSPTAIPPSTVNSQTLSGTAGSYARLAASPTLVTAGASFGFLFNKQFRLEAGFARTVWGQRAADGLTFTACLLSMFDFSKPDLRPKVREVPFENAPSDL